MAAVIMALLIIIGGSQVFLRYLFNYSLTWAMEVSKYLLIWLVFICIGLALKKNRHIGMNALVDHLPKNIKVILQYFTYILEIMIGLAIVFYSIQLIGFATFQTTPTLGIPISIIYYGMVVGGTYITIIAVQFFLASLKKPSSK